MEQGPFQKTYQPITLAGIKIIMHHQLTSLLLPLTPTDSERPKVDPKYQLCGSRVDGPIRAPTKEGVTQSKPSRLNACSRSLGLRSLCSKEASRCVPLSWNG